MSAKKELKKSLKKEKTLIENVVDLSKKVILTKFFQSRLRQVQALGSRLGTRLASIDQLPVLHAEASNRIQELTTTIVNQLKVAYTKDKVIIPDGFYLTYLQLEDGYCILERLIRVKNERGVIKRKMDRVVLFLSDNEDAFLEPIKAGTVKPYVEVENRLQHCKSQIKGDKIVDILLGNHSVEFPFIPSDETIKRYKETKD